ncbi:MAG: HEAT repeat domain-containing protein [Cyanobacteria bacterium J06632_22]
MDISDIETFLDSPNPQSRMKAITELRNHESAVVVPLLKRRMYDQQFLIRSFVAMGLGYKRNEESFTTLLNMIERETDPNVIAEAANSLSKFGPESLPYLIKIFEEHPHWLVRQSIFAAFEDLYDPDVLLGLCRLGLEDPDATVKLAAIANLRRLYETDKSNEALDLLIECTTDSNGLIRARAARVLKFLDVPRAQPALDELRQDSDYRVVRVLLEGLL